MTPILEATGTTKSQESAPSVAVLQKYYQHVLTLQEYLTRDASSTELAGLDDLQKAEKEMAAYLNCTLVCLDSFMDDFLTSPTTRTFVSHSDVIASIIDHVMRVTNPGEKNMLTLGYSRGNERNRVSFTSRAGLLLVNEFPNSSINHLKGPLWTSLVSTLGAQVISSLLCRASLYVNIKDDAYVQLSGMPLVDKKAPKISHKRLSDTAAREFPMKKHCYGKAKLRDNHEVIIVRSRLFYARPAFDSQKKIVFGLKHIHLLNRTANLDYKSRAQQLLENVFPLQYSLHNVFQSDVDKKETVQPFKDYTYRNDVSSAPRRRPRRLNTSLVASLLQMQDAHSRCSYIELLNHYCPVQSYPQRWNAVSGSSKSLTQFHTQDGVQLQLHTPKSAKVTTSKAFPSPAEVLTNHASDNRSICGFLNAVLHTIVPHGLLGGRNIERLSQNLQSFLFLRRYETTTLRVLMCGISTEDISWLSINEGKCSLSDTRKKQELLSELLYWIIDSLIIPILKSHFYVTESHMYRNRVLYFRHDVWREITERELAKLKLTMLTEVETTVASTILQSRQLGFAYLRLLPKGAGARPITNLKRRGMSKDGTGKTTRGSLLPSINSIMQSVYSIISCECRSRPNLLGFSISSVSGLLQQLKRFRATLAEQKYKGKLFFAKADVKSCFDTIDQGKVINIVAEALLEDTYMLQRYCAIIPSLGKIGRKFNQRAIPEQDYEDFSIFAKLYAAKKSHVILVDGVTHQFKEKDHIIALLKDHITMHLIKIGKRFFRQDTGIPQGSILSSILCNIYYADFEAKMLGFMQKKDSMCVRLIDDFLYISADQRSAEEFLQVMHEGNPDYGCFVSSSKSLANFDVIAAGEHIPVLTGTLEFPYCGTTVNTITLNIRKDFSRSPDLAVSDTLTMDYTNGPGAAIVPKIFQGLKLSCQTMFVDTAFNGLYTVLLNIYRSYVFGAMRFVVALKDLKSPNSKLRSESYGAILELTKLLFIFLKSRGRTEDDVQCAVTQVQIDWLGKHAFRYVLRTRPAGYETCLDYLDRALHEKCLSKSDEKILRKVTHPRSLDCFASFVY